MIKEKLRTKTGCFTCRTRRVKCSEERPSCLNCSLRGRDCKWPLPFDLYDRRHRRLSNRIQIDTDRNPDGGLCFRPIDMDPDNRPDVSSPCLGLTILRNPTAPAFHSDIEATLFQHFGGKFLSTVILPNAHPGFRSEYLSYVADLSIRFNSVRCSVLACSALNKYMLTNNPQFRETSLVYYSQAVKEVNRLLDRNDWAHDSPSDATITSIIWLYIHSLWGTDTTEDAHKHVKGAVQILNLRYAQSPNPLSMARPWDRVTTESVLYQSFLLSIRHPFTADFLIDPDFLLRSESILESRTFLDASPTANSPVLGLPLQLYRLILSIIHSCSSPVSRDPEASVQIKNEMIGWEGAVNELETAYDVTLMTEEDLHSTTIALYVLAASLLLDLVLDSLCEQPIPSLPSSVSRWQLRRAMEILRYSAVQEQWTRCFLGSWPLQIFGYAVDNEEDVALIRRAMQNMREWTGYGEVERIINELESIWQGRINQGNISPYSVG